MCARILLLFFSSFCTLHNRIEIGILCSVSQSISHTVLLIVVVSHTHTRSHAHLLSFIPPQMISFFSVFFNTDSRFISPLMLPLHSIYVSHTAHTCTRAPHFFSSVAVVFFDFRFIHDTLSNHATVFYFRVNRC